MRCTARVGAALMASVILMFGGCGSDPDTDSGIDGIELPDIAYCHEVSAWDPLWVDMEVSVLDLVNQRRGEGANCGSEGSFGPADPLTLEPALLCAARAHSLDMAERDYFSHDTPDGVSPWDRMEQAGYNFSRAGENIARGQPSPDSVISSWMGSDGHCANIMNPAFTHIGVGYYQGNYWTQTFGRP